MRANPRHLIIQGATAPFLVLQENRFAHAAFERLLQPDSAVDRSWTYVYGPSGVGKSHLVKQFLQKQRRNSPSIRSQHLTAAEFVDQWDTAYSSHSLPELEQGWDGVDVFICEDLQALEKRPRYQKSLLALLDTLTNNRVAICLTCSKSPGELRSFLPRLTNRFRGGVCASVKLPAISSRVNLLQHFAQVRQLALSTEVAQTLAEALPVSPRELSAAIVRLEAHIHFNKSVLSVKSAEQYLAEEVKPKIVKLPDVAKVVARHFRLHLCHLRTVTRQPAIMFPRQCAMYLARELTDNSLRNIAAYFGNRNHTAVLHACRRLATLMLEEPAIDGQLNQLRRQL